MNIRRSLNLSKPVWSAVFLGLFVQLSTGKEVFSQAAETQQRVPPRVDAIDSALQRFVDEGAIAGAVTLVAHEGKIVHLGAVGYQDLASKTSMSPRTMFSIASMTKPIVASAIMKLQEQGKLNITDPVSKYLPDFAKIELKDSVQPARQITIQDALTHTSGLAGNQLFDGSLEQAVDQLAQTTLAFEPGSKWQYSPGLNVAGRIVEVVSGQKLDAFLDENFFTPLKMGSTTFFPNLAQQKRVATLYKLAADRSSLEPAENRITKAGGGAAAAGTEAAGPNPSGGLFSTAPDMFRFYQMVLGKGKFRGTQILTRESVEQMTAPQTGELVTGFTPGNCWGLGWCILREPQGVTEMLSPGTFGHGGAFGTQGWVDPKTKTIYVLMIQRTDLGNSDGSDIRVVFQKTAAEIVAKH